MQIHVELQRDGASVASGVLTDERAESSYGLPVLVLDADRLAYGPGEVAPELVLVVAGEAEPEALDAAERAGWRIGGQP